MDRGGGRGMRSNNWSFEILEPRLVMAGVIINEFLAVNTNGVQDLDGDRPDWIELRNTSAANVDLTGWHLTDDSGDLDKWETPAINLAPGAYLTIFASGKDRAVAGQELHTNFSLEQNGEYLALVMPDGVTVVQAFDPFPAQVANVSYGAGAGGGGTDSLVGELAPLSFFVPPSSIGTSWQTIGFNDSAWTSATTGIGYDRSSTVSYDPLIGFDVEAQMFNLQSTIYLRYEFDLANPNELQSLNLRMTWDDGFVAYLNGQEIKRQQFGAASTPVWNSPSEGSRSDSTCLVPVDFDVSAFLGHLQAGPNVLAIHGMNTSLNSNDMLTNARLIAQREVPGQEGYMATPTFGAANTQGTLGVVADTTFSLDRGFYSSPQSVTIATTTVGAQIRYTLDGSMPTATTGLIYLPGNPIQINTTTILRAAAFKTGFTPTNVDTQTYIFLDDVIQQDGSGLPAHAPWGHVGPDWDMDPNIVNNPTYSGTIKDDLKAVPTVSLIMPWNSWFGAGGEGIYIAGSNMERQGSIEFFSADGTEEFQIDGALEIVGGTSDERWRNDKLSIRGSFKPPFGPTKLDSEVFKDQGATTEFDTLIFDAVFNWSWSYGGASDLPYQRTQAKYIQDQFVADLQQKMGGAAPHGRFVQLYINGLYWGMYYLHERPDSSFAEAYLGGDKDDYDVIKHNLNVDNIVDGDATAHANYNVMLDAVRANMSVPANYTTVQQWLDVDDFIDYMLVNYYAGNTDWSHQNWYASFNRVDPNGRWRFHSWDAEHVLRATAPIQPTSDPVQADVTTKNNANSPTEIHNRLIANPEYKLRFADRVQKHFFNGGTLTPAATDAVYLARMLEINRAIVGESARWGDNRDEPGYTRVDWLTTQGALRSNYFPFRTGVVINQFNARNWLSSVAAPSFSQLGGQVLQGFDLTIIGPPGVGVYYTTNGDDPRAVGGGINGTLYSSPVDISTGLTVKARAFDGVNWSALTEATFTVAAPAGTSNLRIVEIHYNPPATPGVGDAQNLEFIELLNPSGQAVSLDGVQITEFDNTPYTFPAGMMLGAGERIVVPKNTTVFQSIYGGSILLAPGGYVLANLSNGGERIALIGPGGEIQNFVFDDADGWPTAADGQGSSLEIIDPMGDASSPLNWRASAQHGGSPGSDGLPPAGTPGDFDGDDDVDGSDFLEWQRGLGTTSPNAVRANGDADGDQDVDAADLGQWKTNFGPAPAVAVAAASVSGAGEEAGMRSAFLSPGKWIVLSDSHFSKRDARQAVREEIVDETFEAGYAPGDERGMMAASLELPWFNVLLEEADASALDLALESELTRGLEGNLVVGEF